MLAQTSNQKFRAFDYGAGKVNRKPPSFPFYAKDWKSSLTVRRMTPEQRGYYIQLLAEAWDSSEPGFIPDAAPIWWIAGAISEDNFKPSRETVLSCFKRDNRGRYYSEKLVEVRRQQLEWREKCSAGGKKSRRLNSTKYTEITDKVTSSIPVGVTVAKAKSKSKEQRQYSSDFLKFYEAYPKKESKWDAFVAFEKAGINGMLEHVIKTVADHVKFDPKWMNREFIPLPATYINKRKWEDELETNRFEFLND